MKRLICALLLAGTACAPSIGSDPKLSQSPVPRALFAPNPIAPCLSVLPQPNDLARDTSNPAAPHLNLPMNCSGDTATDTAVKRGLSALDGFSLNAALTAPVSWHYDESTVLPYTPTGAWSFLVLDTSTMRPVSTSQVPVSVTGSDAQITLKPDAPLKPGTTYLAVLTTDIKDSSGNNLVSDQVFTFVKSREPLADAAGKSRYSAVLDDASAAALEPLRSGMAPALTALEQLLGVSRDRVLVAWTFTTQSLQPRTAALVQPLPGASSTAITATLPPAALGAIPHSNLCQIVQGQATLKSALSAVGFNPGTLTDLTQVNYLITTPKTGGGCDAWDGAKVAIFAHGLGRCRNDALALADALAAQGFALLAFDGPGAGDATATGCTSAPERLAGGDAANPNPFAARDNLREWSFRLAQFAKGARANPFAFAGVAVTPTGPAQVVLIGHSFGGVAALEAASTEDVSAVVTTGATGDLGAVLASTLPTVPAQTLATLRWILEPVDPLFAPTLVSKAVLTQRIGMTTGDEVPLHPIADQNLLAAALGTARPESLFDLSVCPAASRLGSLLQPCLSSDDPNYGVAALGMKGLQRQLATFALTAVDGSAAPTVCAGDFTVPCP